MKSCEFRNGVFSIPQNAYFFVTPIGDITDKAGNGISEPNECPPSHPAFKDRCERG
jgi:hypothetical protein